MRIGILIPIIAWFSTFNVFASNNSLPVAGNRQHSSPIVPIIIATTGVGLSLVLDKPVFQLAHHNQTPFSRNVTKVTDMLGEKTYLVPALLTTFGGSLVIKNTKLRNTSWNAIKAVMLTSLSVEGLKTGIGRARPFMNEGNLSFHSFNGNDVYKSMPSGHSSFAFALLTPFAETYSRWIYVIPASVAMGRVWQQKHWLSDVVVGGGIGWLSGYLFTHSKKKIIVTPQGLVIWF